jgi:pilus assembly protein Flp/PilA
MTKLFSKFIKNESGATAIEYGLIAVSISIACIAMWQWIGGSFAIWFTVVGAHLAR